MNKQRFLVLLIAATVVLGGALFFSTRREASQEPQGAALLPSLDQDINAVTEVQIVKGGASPAVTLRKTASGWTLAQRADYPADLAKLRKLLLALRDAKIVEVKTADPTLFGVIGVEDPAKPDPAKPDPAGAEVTVVAPHGKQSIIVGKPVGEGNFVRRKGENQAYSVEPSIAVDADPRHWINPRLLDLPSATIESVQFKPAGNAPKTTAGYTLVRSNPTDNSFTLADVPAGRKALGAQALAPGPTTFTGLDAEDVAAAGDIDFGQAATIIIKFAGGNVVTLRGAATGDKHWLTVEASQDAALSARTKGRAFEIASYRYDAIFKPLEQLLEPKETGRTATVAAPAAGLARHAAGPADRAAGANPSP
jgi:hypothetical protein